MAPGESAFLRQLSAGGVSCRALPDLEVPRGRCGLGWWRVRADASGISQSTLSWVISGQRAAKVPELVVIAWATGVTIAELAGTGTVAERAECAARATNHANMDGMREALLHFLELDDYLSDQAIPATALPEGNVDGRDGGWRICRAVSSGSSSRSAAAGRSRGGYRTGDWYRRSRARRRTGRAWSDKCGTQPGHVLFQDWADTDAGDWSAAVQRFLVSPQVAAIALCQAGCIDEPTRPVPASAERRSDYLPVPLLATWKACSPAGHRHVARDQPGSPVGGAARSWHHSD
jgi:hypothetical protein